MSNKQRKIFVVDGMTNYANWCQATIVDKMEKADICMWTGGQDVTPGLYNRRAHPSSSYHMDRDAREIDMFHKARDLGKPMIGTCRGCQFLTVMAGGILVQDQPDPYHHHPITTFDGEQIVVTSSHHQASYPWGLPSDQFKVLGWTVDNSAYHWGERDGDELVTGVVSDDKEVEIVYFPKIRALGIQSHPEWDLSHAESGEPDAAKSIAYFRALLDRFLAGTL